MKPTLFLIGCRNGQPLWRIKTIDGLGPNGETIMDYSNL